jgi:hypothetical protein
MMEQSGTINQVGGGHFRWKVTSVKLALSRRDDLLEGTSCLGQGRLCLSGLQGWIGGTWRLATISCLFLYPF